MRPLTIASIVRQVRPLSRDAPFPETMKTFTSNLEIRARQETAQLDRSMPTLDGASPEQAITWAVFSGLKDAYGFKYNRKTGLQPISKLCLSVEMAQR